jgi:Tfp pilus assembly protein PilF
MEPRQVIPSLEKLLSQGKESALLRFSLGTEYFKLHETWVSVFHLKRAIELDPEYSAAWKLLGMALAENGILHEALDAWRRGAVVAEKRGDKQAAKEMGVFVRRLEKKLAGQK